MSDDWKDDIIAMLIEWVRWKPIETADKETYGKEYHFWNGVFLSCGRWHSSDFEGDQEGWFDYNTETILDPQPTHCIAFPSRPASASQIDGVVEEFAKLNIFPAKQS